MKESQIFKVKGMHCASCAVNIEKTLKKTDGVLSAEVNYGIETAKVSFDQSKTNPENLSKKIEPLGYSFDLPTAEEMDMSAGEHAAHLGLGQSKKEKLAELDDLKRKTFSTLPLAAFSIFVMAWDLLANFGMIFAPSFAIKEFFHHLLPIFATYAIFYAGTPYLLGVYRFLRYRRANMDSLIGIGTLTAFIYSFVLSAFEESLRPYVNVNEMYYDITIVLVAFITLGKYLEARSRLKTGDAIEKLLNLQVKTALVIRNGKEIEVPIAEVIHDDILVIKPGSKIPVDGILTEGQSFVDESMISGEPIPIEKNKGDGVMAGTINTTGTFNFRATKVGSETMLSNIIKMVEEAQASKAPIQALADRVSGIFVPAVIVIAFVSFGAWIFIGTEYFGFAKALSYGLVSFVGVLVIACPCALGLATPTAIMVGVGRGARDGILVKDAATLETLHKINAVVVDKTGTITKGKPELVSFEPQGISGTDFLSALASLESRSEHPIAHAIVTYAEAKNIPIKTPENFEIIKGKGLKGNVGGIEYFAGGPALAADLGHQVDKEKMASDTRKGNTPIILATEEKFLGVAFVADALKLEAKEAISKLHKLSIRVIMLTGDDKNTAEYIAKEAGIDEVFAEVLPGDKLLKIKELQKQGLTVAMAGDGVNDAPALAQADVGIAMATGTDVAIESAGITLLAGDISKLAQAIRLSKITMAGIKQNLFWAFIYNIVGIPLAAGVFYPLFGWLLNPIFAGLAMALSSVSVVSNSLRIKAKNL